MKIKDLSLTNFHGFPGLSMDLEGKSAVIFGINGAGKSSILKGINLTFARLIKKAIWNSAALQDTFKAEDVLSGEACGEVAVRFLIESESNVQLCKIEHRKAASKIIYTSNTLVAEFQRVYRPDDYTTRLEAEKLLSKFSANHLDSLLPILINYGVNRTVLDIPLRIHQRNYERHETYSGSTSSKIDFRSFFEWFRNQEDYEFQRRNELKDFEYEDPALRAVRSAITTMMPDIKNIRVDRRPLRMRADKYLGIPPEIEHVGRKSARMKLIAEGYQSLCIEQLSDGEKCTIALLGDIVRRLALANPDRKDVLMGPGIVLIDEIELHMHPEWQRRIIHVLHETFPNIQFIITTHSPQVIGEMPEDESFLLYRLERDEELKSPQLRQIKSAYYDSNLVLEDFMRTSSLNTRVKDLESKMFRFIENRNFAAAQELCDEITHLTNGTNPAITKATILIRRGKQSNLQ